jgi:hypothetical protein
MVRQSTAGSAVQKPEPCLLPNTAGPADTAVVTCLPETRSYCTVFSYSTRSYYIILLFLAQLVRTALVFRTQLVRTAQVFLTQLAFAATIFRPTLTPTRYEMLVKELLRKTDEDHDEHGPLEKALAQISESAHAINEVANPKSTRHRPPPPPPKK